MTGRAENVYWLLAVPVLSFCVLLLVIEIAYRVTRSHPSPPPARAAGSASSVVFSLLALVLAFAYADASGRLERHRALAVEEANAIQSVLLRIDLLDEGHRESARALLREYTDARVLAQEEPPYSDAFEQQRLRAEELQRQLWDEMVRAVREDEHAQQVVLLPPVLALSDVAAMRDVALKTHLSSPAFTVMFLLALASAVLVGVTTAAGEQRNWPYRLIFASAVAGALSIVIDMEYPRTGLDQAAVADRLLLDLRDSME